MTCALYYVCVNFLLLALFDLKSVSVIWFLQYQADRLAK